VTTGNIVGKSEITAGTLYSSGTLQVGGVSNLKGDVYCNGGVGSIFLETINSGDDINFLNTRLNKVYGIYRDNAGSGTDRTGLNMEIINLIRMNEANLDFQDTNHIVNCPEIDNLATSTLNITNLYNANASTDTAQWTFIYTSSNTLWLFVNNFYSAQASTNTVLFTQSYNVSNSTGNFIKQDGYNGNNASVTVGTFTSIGNIWGGGGLFIGSISKNGSGKVDVDSGFDMVEGGDIEFSDGSEAVFVNGAGARFIDNAYIQMNGTGNIDFSAGSGDIIGSDKLDNVISTATALWASKVNKTGDTMSGQLNGTYASFQNIYSSNSLISGTSFYADHITELTPGHGVFIDRFRNHYAGVWNSQPNLIDNGDGTVTVSTCEVIIYNSPDFKDGSWLKYVSAATLTPTNKEVSFICINWNAGTPAYELVTLANRYTINQSSIIPVYRVFRDDNVLDYYVSYGALANGLPNKEADRIIRLRGIERESGFGITAVEGRHFKIDSGAFWFGLTRFPRDISMSSAPAITEVNHWSYQPGGWMVSSSTGMWHNTMYQTATSTAEVTANRAVTTWIYASLYKNEVDLLYGTEGNDNLATALTRTEPTARPPHLDQFYKLVGRIIATKGSSTADSVQSITDTTLTSSFDTSYYATYLSKNLPSIRRADNSND